MYLSGKIMPPSPFSFLTTAMKGAEKAMWGYSKSHLHLKQGRGKEGYWEDRDRKATCQDKKKKSTSFDSPTQLLPERSHAPFHSSAFAFFSGFKLSNSTRCSCCWLDWWHDVKTALVTVFILKSMSTQKNSNATVTREGAARFLGRLGRWRVVERTESI